jgi:hypothetical protein
MAAAKEIATAVVVSNFVSIPTPSVYERRARP